MRRKRENCLHPKILLRPFFLIEEEKENLLTLVAEGRGENHLAGSKIIYLVEECSFSPNHYYDVHVQKTEFSECCLRFTELAGGRL